MHVAKRINHFFSFISPHRVKQNKNQESKPQEEELLESRRQEAFESIPEPFEITPSETEDSSIVTAEKFHELCTCLRNNGIKPDEAATVAQAICYILCDEETEQYFPLEKVTYVLGYLGNEQLFNTPIIECSMLGDPVFVCRNFREYASTMMFPDPTYVEISTESQDLITSLINEGKMTPFEALKAFESDYRYDEEGREYIFFPTPETIMEIYHKKHPDKPSE